jgi:hypothetical protein
MRLWEKLFEYDDEAGVLLWKEGLRRGKRAGSLRDSQWSRRQVRYTSEDKKTKYVWYEHRIIWSLVHGDIPEGYVIDHIDGDGCNNRIENLRCVTPQINSRNRKLPSTNTSGVMGVNWIKKKRRWRACIHHAGKFTALGTYKTFKEAVAARKAAEKVLGYISR